MAGSVTKLPTRAATCRGCARRFEHARTGRPRRFCSNACRQRNYRDRQRGGAARHARSLDLRLIPLTRANRLLLHALCKRHHYAQHAHGSMWGWLVVHGDRVVGATTYNVGSRSLNNLFRTTETDEPLQVWHHSRLVLIEGLPKGTASQVIGMALRKIRREFPNVAAVVSYADTAQGHTGTIYRATNALYTGTNRRTAYTDAQGRQKATYSTGGWISTTEARTRGWTVSNTTRHRYVYLLGSRTRKKHLRAQMRWPVLPYPRG